MKCSFTIQEYTKMSSRNTTMLESSTLENMIFMVYMNAAGAFISSMGITTHLYKLYLIRNTVFRISSLAIWHYQYPLERSIDMKYFAFPM